MTSRAVKITTLPLAVGCFVVGWIAYHPVLRIVSSGIEVPITTPKPTEAFTHHFTMALMIAFLGLMIGLATLVSGRFSPKLQYGTRFASLLLGGLVVAVGMTYYLSYDFSLAYKLLSSRRGDPYTDGISWSIRAFPLHQIGLYAGIAMLIAGVVICLHPSYGKALKNEDTPSS